LGKLFRRFERKTSTERGKRLLLASRRTCAPAKVSEIYHSTVRKKEVIMLKIGYMSKSAAIERVAQGMRDSGHFKDKIREMTEKIRNNWDAGKHVPNNFTAANILNFAFTWADTPEGSDYWIEVYRKLRSKD
jgi:hypothetical protein